MRIAIVTDAWAPQVNGVVRTLEAVTRELVAQGHAVEVIAPDRFATVPCPTYPEIRLAIAGAGALGRMLSAFGPEAIHLSTEGPLCLAARRWCTTRALPFTTAYHTRFPEYVAARTGMNPDWIWRYIRWFHAPAHGVLTATASIRRTLIDNGIAHVRHWGRGVDLAHFHSDTAPHPALAHLSRPIQLYVGRVAVEKNIEAFLRSRHPGTKLVVGDGPARAALERDYPQAIFMGARFACELASIYAAADVFVFPSRTDTFGLVMIEALACGTPVAAFPVAGPADVVRPGVGALDDDLDRAIAAALTRDRAACAAYGGGFTWRASAAEFVAALAPIARETRRAA